MQQDIVHPCTSLFNTCSPLGLGTCNNVHMVVTHTGVVWLTTLSWSELSCRISLAQCFDQSSLDHTSVGDVRPDCSSTRTRPAKRSLTDHINGRFCISNPLSVTDILKSHARHNHQGLSPLRYSEEHAELQSGIVQSEGTPCCMTAHPEYFTRNIAQE